MKNIVTLSLATGILGGAFVIAGCGGDSETAACAGSAPCGGNVAGTWMVSSSCISIYGFQLDGCPTATAKGKNLALAGTVSYTTDLTFSSDISLSGSVQVNLPTSCLTFGGVTVTCAQFQQELRAQPSSSSATCVSAGKACDCNLPLPVSSSVQTGTYTTTAAGVLTETDAEGVPDRSDYCVKGSTMTLSSVADTMMVMGEIGVAGTVTLMKQ